MVEFGGGVCPIWLYLPSDISDITEWKSVISFRITNSSNLSKQKVYGGSFKMKHFPLNKPILPGQCKQIQYMFPPSSDPIHVSVNSNCNQGSSKSPVSQNCSLRKSPSFKNSSLAKLFSSI